MIYIQGFMFYLSSLNVSDEDVIISPTFRYPSGSDQQFQESGYIVTPSDIDSDKLTYDPENDQHRFPLVILMQTTSDLSKPHPLLLVHHTHTHTLACTVPPPPPTHTQR